MCCQWHDSAAAGTLHPVPRLALLARRTRPIPPDVTFTTATLATATPALRAQMQVEPPARRTNKVAAVARQTLPGTLPGAAVGAATPTAGAAANASAAAANASAAAANASGVVAASLAASQAPAIQQVPVSSAAAGASSGLPGAQQPVAVSRTASLQPIVTGRRLLGRSAQHSTAQSLHTPSQQYSGSQQYSHSQHPAQQYSHTSPNRSGRQLLVLQDELDAFRRGPIREQCAQEAAADWRPYLLFNLTDDLTTNPRYSGLLQGGDVVAVISEASANLNRLRNEAPVQQQLPAVTQPQPQPQPAGGATEAAAAAAAGGGETAATAVLPAGGAAAVQQLG